MEASAIYSNRILVTSIDAASLPFDQLIGVQNEIVALSC